MSLRALGMLQSYTFGAVPTTSVNITVEQMYMTPTAAPTAAATLPLPWQARSFDSLVPKINFLLTAASGAQARYAPPTPSPTSEPTKDPTAAPTTPSPSAVPSSAPSRARPCEAGEVRLSEPQGTLTDGSPMQYGAYKTCSWAIDPYRPPVETCRGPVSVFG